MIVVHEKRMIFEEMISNKRRACYDFQACELLSNGNDLFLSIIKISCKDQLPTLKNLH